MWSVGQLRKRRNIVVRKLGSGGGVFVVVVVVVWGMAAMRWAGVVPLLASMELQLRQLRHACALLG